MSNYTNTFGGAAKDAAESIIQGTDFDTEFDNIATMSGTKANKAVPASTDNVATLSASGDLQDGGFKPTAYVKTILDDADAGAVKDTLLLSTSVTITPSSDADVTLSSTQATYGRLILVDGSWTSAHNIIVPTNQRSYWVDNSAGTYTATVKTSAGTGIPVAAGTSRPLVCDGTNVIDPLPAAGEGNTGVIEIATTVEVKAGTDTSRAITPAGLRAGALVAGTAVASTSGTSIDFTSIPDWVKRITVMLSGVSTNSTANVIVQLGTSSGVETSGYLGAASVLSGSVTTNNYTNGINLYHGVATNIRHSVITIVKLTGNTWVATGVSAVSDSATMSTTASSKTLSGTLDRVRITTGTGTDTFDAGTVNIMYE